MWYLILYGILAIWIFIDDRKRKGKPVVSSILTLLIGPIYLPFYFATRDLKEGEVREGGRGWNIMKNFVIFWTLLCFVWVIFGTVLAGKEMEHQGDLEQFGTALGATIGIGIIIAIWFFGSFVSLTIGLLIRKSTIVERGPTGALAVSSLPTS